MQVICELRDIIICEKCNAETKEDCACQLLKELQEEFTGTGFEIKSIKYEKQEIKKEPIAKI